VSSSTAVVIGPMAVGSWVNRTPVSGEPLVFPANVLYGKHHERNPVGGERVLEGANGRVLVGLEN
jgi:hypothetical protein